MRAGWQRWQLVGPSELAAADGWPVPRQLSAVEIETVVEKFGQAGDIREPDWGPFQKTSN